MCDVRHTDNNSSLGCEYLVNLLQCKFRVDEVFQNVAAEHRIKVAAHMFNPIRPVEVVDHHLLTPLPGLLGGFRIYFHAGHMAAALLQMAADKAISTSEFKDFASLGSQIKKNAVTAMRIVEHGFVVITVSQ